MYAPRVQPLACAGNGRPHIALRYELPLRDCKPLLVMRLTRVKYPYIKYLYTMTFLPSPVASASGIKH